MNYESRIMHKYKKLSLFALSFGLILTSYFLIPAFANAANLIPCTNTPGTGGVVPASDVCDFNALMQLVSNALKFLVELALPLATITIIYAGFLYLTTAVSDQKSKAKTMLINVVIGFAVLLAAFVIVRTIINVLLRPEIRSHINL
jgi:hypothetical protein